MSSRTLSVGLADIHQFMALISTVGWEKTVASLQDAVTAIGDLIVQHGGQIRKYVGDAVLFTFDDPRQAIRAARAIAGYRQTVDSFMIRFYVSVATGEVLETEFGHPAQRVHDIFGQPVNRVFDLIRPARASPDGVALCEVTQTYAD